MAARQGGNHRQRPGQPDDTQLRGVHGLRAADRRRGQEPGESDRCRGPKAVLVLRRLGGNRRGHDSLPRISAG